MVLAEPDMVDRLGFSAAEPSLPGAFTSIFLHQNLIHLLGNMVFLAAVGPAVEIGAGTIRFLSVFLGGGLAGVAAHWALAPKMGGVPPLIGASGAIAACAAYYSLRYYRLKVPIAPNLGLPIVAIAGVWLALQAVGAFVSAGGPVPSVSYWAHLGGFAFGLLAGAVFGAPKLADLELGHEALDRLNQRSPAARLSAAKHQLETHPNDVRALREMAEAYADLGDVQDEASTLLLLLDALPEIEQSSVLKRLHNLNRLEEVPALRRSLFAERCKETDRSLARDLLQSVAAEPNGDQRPDALLALAALEREEQPHRASALLKELLDEYPMHPAAEVARKRGWAS